MARVQFLSALFVAVVVAALMPAGECGVKRLFHKAEHGVARAEHAVGSGVKKGVRTAAAVGGLAAGAVYGTVTTAGGIAKKAAVNAGRKAVAAAQKKLYNARSKLADAIAPGHRY